MQIPLSLLKYTILKPQKSLKKECKILKIFYTSFILNEVTKLNIILCTRFSCSSFFLCFISLWITRELQVGLHNNKIWEFFGGGGSFLGFFIIASFNCLTFYLFLPCSWITQRKLIPPRWFQGWIYRHLIHFSVLFLQLLVCRHKNRKGLALSVVSAPTNGQTNPFPHTSQQLHFNLFTLWFQHFLWVWSIIKDPQMVPMKIKEVAVESKELSSKLQLGGAGREC